MNRNIVRQLALLFGRGIAVGLAAALLSLGGVGRASAQSAGATLTGTVADPSGATIPGAVVTATNTQNGAVHTATTDAAGHYTVTDLAPSSYNIQATHAGFSTGVTRGQQFLIGTAVTEDFVLKLATSSTTVEVSAAPAVINPTQSAVADVMTGTQLDNLPNLGRAFSSLADLTPGVQGSSIGNQPSYATGYVLDGITDETGNQGNAYVQMAQDWIQEFSVASLQSPAEYGNASGGTISAVTRSGGNQIHGRAYDFYQNANLNSNPSFYTLPGKSPFLSNRYGAMIGGPVIKNKLFYFVGYEGFHQSSASTRNAKIFSPAFLATAQPSTTPVGQLVPWLVDGTGVLETNTQDNKWSLVKINYDPSANNQINLSGALNLNRNASTGYGAIGPFGGSPSHGLADPYSTTLGWTRVLSASALNDLEVGYFQNGRGSANWTGDCSVYPAGKAQYLEPYNYVTTGSLGGTTAWGNPDGYFTGVSYAATGLGTGGGGYCGGIQNNDGAIVATDSLSLVRGAHNLKFGVSVRRSNLWSRDAQNNSAGGYNFASNAGPFNPTTPILQNYTAAGFKAAEALAPYTYKVLFNGSPGLTTFSFHDYAFGLYAQDNWNLRQGLTLNVGLRYDHSDQNSSLATETWPALEAVDPGAQGYVPSGYHPINNDDGDIAPRIGFAWTPFKNSQRTVIRGGIGVFYNANDGANAGIYITSNSWATNDYNFTANTATLNPYCIGNTNCATAIPAQDEIAVTEVLAAALANYTLPQFPLSTSPCAATNTCTVSVGGNTYTIPALTIPYTPEGGRVDLAQSYKVPGTVQETIGVQHEFGKGLTIAADYVHRVQFNGLAAVNSNVGLVGTGATSAYTTINPAFTSQFQMQSIATQTTNDLDSTLSYRDHRGDSVHVSYQFGYSNDNSLTNFGVSAHSSLTTDPFNINYDYGPSSSDVRHLLSVDANLPIFFGVTFSPVFRFASGSPYTASSSDQSPGTALAPAGCLAYFSKCYPAGYTRNSLRGVASYNLDARLAKTVKLGESRSVTAFLEAYNIPNYNNAGTGFFSNIDASNFGQPQDSSQTLRQIQLGARFDF